jgi:two-component system sensor histidine kinase CpxA
MNLVRRSLFAKIFLWFCLTIVVATTLVLLAASLTGSQPFGKRWMAMTQDLYAHSAVDFYTTGGAPALRKFQASIFQMSAIEGSLISADGVNVLGIPFPEHTRRVYQQALKLGRSTARPSRFWTAASPVVAPDGQHYVFVMEAHPLRGFIDGTFFFSVVPRLFGGLVLSALLCFLLARHITRPIRTLEEAATRMARGDLAVRTMPSMAGRTDELALMAKAFDSMAERIDTLLTTERQMLADISHELRSPLTRIGVSLELLSRGEQDAIEPMRADLDRLNTMIGRILELARFDLQDPAAAQGSIDLCALLEDVVESANYEGRQKHCVVALSVCGQAFVVGEYVALHSCFENIVRNAISYSPTDSSVAVTLRVESEQLLIFIEDSGPGVPEESLARIFAPFFRMPTSMASHPNGTGLGLSISARIVARYGGSIHAENRSPRGLCVQVQLPAQSAAL